jgi:hypothetical protein
LILSFLTELQKDYTTRNHLPFSQINILNKEIIDLKLQAKESPLSPSPAPIPGSTPATPHHLLLPQSLPRPFLPNLGHGGKEEKEEEVFQSQQQPGTSCPSYIHYQQTITSSRKKGPYPMRKENSH